MNETIIIKGKPMTDSDDNPIDWVETNYITPMMTIGSGTYRDIQNPTYVLILEVDKLRKMCDDLRTRITNLEAK